mgnify:CR=1 FL=1
MGSVGPDLETVYQAGCDMTEFFLDKDARNIVIMSGGASSGNRLHQVRTWGMLNTLEEKAGLVLNEDAEKLSATDKVTELTDKDGNLHVTICRDIPRVERDLTIWRPHLRKAPVIRL